MKYQCKNTLNGFSFQEAVIAQLQLQGQTFSMNLDNVTILADNPHNRDIHDMRANSVLVTFTNASIDSFIAESYKVYDADGNLSQTQGDVVVEPNEYQEMFDSLSGASSLYTIHAVADGACSIEIDGPEHTYQIQLSYTDNYVAWDRFLKK